MLGVAATRTDPRRGAEGAYAGAAVIDWPAKILRKDIGRKSLEGQYTAGESGFFRLDPPNDD
ncbi:MAG: hypothetical protein R2862_09480 [Thermoanaerobaculia bacterium]